MTAQTATRPAQSLTPAGVLRSLRAWRYEGGKRDLRLDLLRGFAVFAMVVDHIGGPFSPFYLITGGNRFFVSAAEAYATVGEISGALRAVFGEFRDTG